MTEQDGERLRRRLYEPGAGSEDVAAFLALREADGEEPVAAPPARRSRRRLVAVAAVGTLAVAGMVAVLRLPPAVETATGPTPLPTASVAAVVRTAFADRAAAGDDAGLAAWWDPTAPFAGGAGAGDGTVDIPPPAGGGRITVLLVLASDATAGWSVQHLVIHDDRTIHTASVGRASGAARAGVPVVGRVDFTALTHPVRLEVHAPPRVRWSAAVVFSD